MLHEFVRVNRAAIIAQARERVVARTGSSTTDEDERRGLPIFLDQLEEALGKATAREAIDHTSLKLSALAHGEDLFRLSVSVDQVVHGYGDVCQVITGLALEQGVDVAVAEFRTLNFCLDEAIADAVTAYSREHDRAIVSEGTERLGVLAHEMRNLVSVAILAFDSIKQGVVAPGGSTSAMVDRTFVRLQSLIDRSLADVRLDAGMRNIDRISVREILEEVAIGASLVAATRRIPFSVTKPEHPVFIESDRQIITAAVANLLQNAFKFTLGHGAVQLRASASATRVLIEVEDGCGGLPPGKADELFLPFSQRGTDRSGVGLGLAICLKAAKAADGELNVRDLPGRGCVFTLDLPRKPAPGISVLEGGNTRSSGVEPNERGSK
jgi:hypothetical protein